MDKTINTHPKGNGRRAGAVIFGANGMTSKREIIACHFPASHWRTAARKISCNWLWERPERATMAHSGKMRSCTCIFLRNRTGGNGILRNSVLSLECFITRQWITSKPKRFLEELKKYAYEVTDRNSIPNNFIYYFSIPPFMYEKVGNHLVSCGLNSEKDGWKRTCQWRNPASIRQKNWTENFNEGFQEHQIYRIDHYLGKWFRISWWPDCKRFFRTGVESQLRGQSWNYSCRENRCRLWIGEAIMNPREPCAIWFRITAAGACYCGHGAARFWFGFHS